MDTSISKLIYFSVSLLLTSVLLLTVAALGLSGSTMLSTHSMRRLTVERSLAYRSFAKFDNKFVSSSDLLNLIQRHARVLVFEIDTVVGSVDTYTKLSVDMEPLSPVDRGIWRIDYITANILGSNIDSLYFASLLRSGDDIEGVRFTLR